MIAATVSVSFSGGSSAPAVDTALADAAEAEGAAGAVLAASPIAAAGPALPPRGAVAGAQALSRPASVAESNGSAISRHSSATRERGTDLPPTEAGDGRRLGPRRRSTVAG